MSYLGTVHVAECVIEGYHGYGARLGAEVCQLGCGENVCIEHRGLHWERSHRSEKLNDPTDTTGDRWVW